MLPPSRNPSPAMPPQPSPAPSPSAAMRFVPTPVPTLPYRPPAAAANTQFPTPVPSPAHFQHQTHYQPQASPSQYQPQPSPSHYPPQPSVSHYQSQPAPAPYQPLPSPSHHSQQQQSVPPTFYRPPSFPAPSPLSSPPSAASFQRPSFPLPVSSPQASPFRPSNFQPSPPPPAFRFAPSPSPSPQPSPAPAPYARAPLTTTLPTNGPAPLGSPTFQSRVLLPVPPMPQPAPSPMASPTFQRAPMPVPISTTMPVSMTLPLSSPQSSPPPALQRPPMPMPAASPQPSPQPSPFQPRLQVAPSPSPLSSPVNYPQSSPMPSPYVTRISAPQFSPSPPQRTDTAAHVAASQAFAIASASPPATPLFGASIAPIMTNDTARGMPPAALSLSPQRSPPPATPHAAPRPAPASPPAPIAVPPPSTPHRPPTQLLAAPSPDLALNFGTTPTPSPTPSQYGDDLPQSAPLSDEEEDEDDSEHHADDLAPQPPVDQADLLARLCSRERIKADDLNFWQHAMDGMEWVLHDTHSHEVQIIVRQYCKNFVANAPRSRNLHSMLLVISRHLENYSQTLHLIVSGEGRTDPLAPPAAAAANGGAVNNAALMHLLKDHAWVTQLLFFLRLVLQFILSNLAYDATLRFFAHLAAPDVKPVTPKANANSLGNWAASPSTTVGESTGDAGSRRALSPMNHTINLNPNSRRSSLGLSGASDILTRFVCAIVNVLEVLGDAPLNMQAANGKAGAPLSTRNSSAPSVTSPTAKASQPIVDLHLELLNTLFVMLSTQMYLPLSTDYEQVFLDRLLYCSKPPMLNSVQGFVTGLISTFTEILPSDWATTIAHKKAPQPKSFFGKITSGLTNLLYFPVWAVRYLFTIPPNHPLIDRATLLIELLVYQNGDNEFRSAIKNLRNADKPRPPVAAPGTALAASTAAVSRVPSLSLSPSPEDYSENSTLDNFELGAVSFDKLYYALCSTLLSEHINLFLYSLIHENASFRLYLLRHHSHDLDYLLMPMLEILYREVDISKHHVYMIVNIWILLTQHAGFDDVIKTIRVKEVPFFKEMPLKDMALTEVMQAVLLRTIQLNLKTKLREPHIFNNLAAAFCNLTITAILGPPSTPLSSGANSPASAPQSPNGVFASASVLALPLTLHPQVAFRLTRVLCILSRKFLSLQSLHETQIASHNARVDRMQASGREELTEEEDREEVELEEVAEELGTCMEFIQLLLEVVNHSIVHALPPPMSPLNIAPPTMVSQYNHHQQQSSSPVSSLARNPHLLYNLLHSREYFLQLLPYAHLFEPHLIANVANVILFYANVPGVNIPAGDAGKLATAGGQSGAGAGKRGVQSEKEAEASVRALAQAIRNTPLSRPASSPVGASPPSGSTPVFDPSALIERGPFTYHEQENSQDFFIPYIYQLAQSMAILPKMYAPSDANAPDDADDPAVAADEETRAALELAQASSALGDVNADEIFMSELADELQSAQPSPVDGEEEEIVDDFDAAQLRPYQSPQLRAMTPAIEHDMTKLNIAIK